MVRRLGEQGNRSLKRHTSLLVRSARRSPHRAALPSRGSSSQLLPASTGLCIGRGGERLFKWKSNRRGDALRLTRCHHHISCEAPKADMGHLSQATSHFTRYSVSMGAQYGSTYLRKHPVRPPYPFSFCGQRRFAVYACNFVEIWSSFKESLGKSCCANLIVKINIFDLSKQTILVCIACTQRCAPYLKSFFK
jgi:hypothetical protein